MTDAATRKQDSQASGAASLVVYGPTGMTTVPLPDDGDLVIGRAAPAQVVIDDVSLSRRHARVFRQDGELFVEDLGSTNGTFLRGVRVTTAPLQDGHEIRVGDIVLRVVDPSSQAVLQGGVLPYAELLRHAEEELVRARSFGRSVALIAVRAATVGGSVPMPPVRAVLRPVDRLGLYARDILLLVMPETTQAQAQTLAHNLSGFGLKTAAVAGPERGSTAQALLDAAVSALLGAPDKGPPSAAPASVFAASQNARMRALGEEIERVATSQLTLLVRGETGVGKDVLARFVHEQSGRKGAFAGTNCGAIPAGLIESTLFGHEKGAFTGADRAQKGLFEQAQGGTLFLDEVGELPPVAQVALLRVLETRTCRRVGGDREVAVDVRVIAATHKDLNAMVAAGTFRSDLLYRLDGYSVELPPLRERLEDIPNLAAKFLEEANARHGRAVTGLTPLALEVLAAYSFPGNVRELRNLVERAVVMTRGALVDAGDFPDRVRNPVTAGTPAAQELAGRGDLRERVRVYEAQLIRAALREHDGNRAKAAEALELPLRTLAYKIRELGIEG